MAPSRQRLLWAAVLISAPAVISGCGDQRGSCGGGGACPGGQFCNFDFGMADGSNCETCTGDCDCGLPPRGQTECNNVCLGPKTGTDGCCCSAFSGAAIQPASDCAGAQMCADNDLACCAHVFSGDGVCNEQEVCYCSDGTLPSQSASGSCPNCDDFPGNAYAQCVPGPGTTGTLSPKWDRDCGFGGGDGERCMESCSGGSSNRHGGQMDRGQCEEMRDPETGECTVCPLALFGGLSLFFVVGVAVSSGAMVGDKLQGEKIKLHREQGVEVQARCIRAWTTIETHQTENGTSQHTIHHITLVYCVPMPAPSEQYYQITMDFDGTSGREQAGAQVMVNHLLAATGDARNVIIVDDMGASQLQSPRPRLPARHAMQNLTADAVG